MKKRNQLWGQLYNQLGDQLHGQLYNQLRGQLYWHISDQARGKSYDRTFNLPTLRHQLRDELKNNMDYND